MFFIVLYVHNGRGWLYLAAEGLLSAAGAARSWTLLGRGRKQILELCFMA